jgi:hypothetical protein
MPQQSFVRGPRYIGISKNVTLDLSYLEDIIADFLER